MSQFYTLAIRILLYISLFCFSLQIHAQTDSLQGKSYEELTQLYDATFRKDPANAKVYATAAYNLAKKEKDLKKIGFSKYNIACCKYLLYKFNESLEESDEVINIAKQLNDNLLLFKSYNLRGNIFCDLDNFIAGLDEYLIAKKYAQLTENPIHLSTISINIAIIKKDNKDFQEAIIVLKENLENLKSLDKENEGRKHNERIALMQLSDTYLKIFKPEEAKYYNDLAFKICPIEKYPDHYYWILGNKAIIEYELQNYEKSIQIFKKIENYNLRNNSRGSLVPAYYYMGNSYHILEKYEKAIEFHEKAIEICDEYRINLSHKKACHIILYHSYTKLKNTEKANENHTKYQRLQGISEEKLVNINNKIHKEHEILPLQEEITILTKDKKKQEKKTAYLYIFLTILLLSLIGLFIYYKKRENQKEKLFQELLSKQKVKHEKTKPTTKKVSIKPKDSKINKNILEHILLALDAFEGQNQFLTKNITLTTLAKKNKTNSKYLSYVINKYKEKSFPNYINDLRISYIVDKLHTNKIYRKYSIKAIANEIGFGNTESFTKAFYKKIGLHPSYYIKKLNELEDK